ncbi:MAG: helix-turn-helix domain-containing protein [bacterium]
MNTPINSNVLVVLGCNVRQRRNEQKLSQEQLAELCGFDRTYISLVERGKRNISFTNLVTLARGLNLTVSQLIEGI